MKLTLIRFAATAALALGALILGGPSAQAAAPECSGEIAVPLYHCINLAGAPDVRLYVQEFQTCENGKITENERSVSAYYFLDPSPDAEPESEEVVTDIKFASSRTTIPDRGDDLTFVMPVSATIKAQGSVFKFKMTTVEADNYKNAPDDQRHYLGTFEQRDAKGKVTTGKLACFID